VSYHDIQGWMHILRRDSAEAADLVPPPWFVFIDADHSYDACKRDIEAWRRVVVPGGILSGHDHSHPPVAQGRAQTPRGGSRTAEELVDSVLAVVAGLVVDADMSDATERSCARGLSRPGVA
jgi:hypothetical protein